MRARGKSCPQTVPCSPMTVQQRDPVDRFPPPHCQAMSFPTFAHALLYGLCMCCFCVHVYVKKG